jgi:hypothetical protein
LTENVTLYKKGERSGPRFLRTTGAANGCSLLLKV